MSNQNKKKNLRFVLTTKEYSDFWYVASLLGKADKHGAFKEMMAFVKKFKEKNE